MLRGDVASPAADACGHSVLGDHLNPAVEVAKLSALFQAQREPAMIQTCMEKSCQPDLGLFGRRGGDELVNAMADQGVKILTQDFRETAIRDSNFAFERNCEDGLVEAIDQFAVIVLGTGNYLDEFLELFFAGRQGGGWLVRLSS
jgi:hypothetical protein